MGRTQSLTSSGRLAVVLVAVRNPLNIGAAARAMCNFGFADLRLVNPYEVAFRKARSAVGATSLLANAREYPSVAEAVADCSLVIGSTAGRNRQIDHEMRSLPDGAPAVHKALRSGNVALLFGSEKRGLSNHDLSYCHWLIRIPTVASNPSMNLGQAVSLCLYELAKDAKAKKNNTEASAKSADLDRVTASLVKALQVSGYLKATNAESEQKIRRMVRRLTLSTGDATTLTGMLRQMLWKMNAGE
ncbi:MAG TPA: RNA methyltransferase [Terriglobales bacterium]